MMIKNVLVILALAVVLGLAMGAFTDAAYAQDVASGDRKLAMKESGTLGNKEFDQDKLPGKLEIGLALGSIVVMIAVFKWL